MRHAEVSVLCCVSADFPTPIYKYRYPFKINDFLEATASVCKSRCSLQSIGKSYEGRDMKIIKVRYHYIKSYASTAVTLYCS